jgi:predicted transcriptional regulator
MITHAPDGSSLERRRLALGLSREALGAAAGGIASATVQRIERGHVRPHPSTLSAIIAALSVRETLLTPQDENGSPGGEPGLPSNPAGLGRNVLEV